MAAQVVILAWALLVRLALGMAIDDGPPPLHSPPELPLVLDPVSCPPTYQDHPLILISMDGFRAEYLTRGLTPTIEALAKVGVRAPYMKPSFPSITFTNHYTIATGLYPGAHGVVANRFYDPNFQEFFKKGRSPNDNDKKWWRGEPIWTTVSRQGKKSATFFWVGSEVRGDQPDYWFKYNGSIPFEQRVKKVISWLELPPEDRPSFITLYMHDPDDTGHDFGPNSPEVEAALIRVDSMVKLLVESLIERNLFSCVNILLVADHGMADAGDARSIYLDDYIPNIKNKTRFWKGAFARFQPNDGQPATKKQMLESLSCKIPEMRVYERSTLPIRWHLSNEPRVEEIVVDVDAGFSVGGDKNFKADPGEHGYDNFFPVMNALFVAHGPDLQRGIEVEAFQNIELYNLMCQLMGVTPSPNNGTWGALNHMLINPPPSPPHLGTERLPRVAGLPMIKDMESYMQDGFCQENVKAEKEENEEEPKWVQILSAAQKNVAQLVTDHFPWGLPSLGQFKNTTILLPHHDTITAYSTALKMPLWTSYTITGKKTGSKSMPWRKDIRLQENETPSCSSYEFLDASYNITRLPLFPPQFTSSKSSAQIPYLMSNAIPSSQQLTFRSRQLVWMLEQWAKWSGNLNVISGPVFDYDSDTFADDLQFLSDHKGVKVPTHMFTVVTRCLVWVDNLSECPPALVDTLAFVYPQYLVVPNCMGASKFAQEFIAKVLDVEKITGFKFFTNMEYDDQVRLGIRMHSNIWGGESWWNRLLTNFYGLGK